ncbi:MAG: FtsQ-type POTRA domain-containing protein [Spirochaetota bacterium]|nr:MAG: FtsQ-type POTRA domain-containing protein [Spirochaetota bacterium]
MGAMIRESSKGEVQNKKLLRGVLIAIIGILVLLVIIKVVPLSHRVVILPIKKVQVYGNVHVTEKEIVKAINLDVPISIITFNRSKAKQLLLKDFRLSKVDMTKLYPDTLRMYIREKDTEAVLVSGDKMYLISKDGVVLSEVAEKEAQVAYPFITLISNNDDIIRGAKIKDFLVHDVLSSMGGIKEKYPAFYKKMASFSVKEDGVYVDLTNELYRIYFGHTVTQEKLERLRALLLVLESEYQGGNTVEIDMSTTHAAVRIGEMRNES